MTAVAPSCMHCPLWVNPAPCGKISLSRYIFYPITTQDRDHVHDRFPALPYRPDSEPSQDVLQSNQDNIRSSALLIALDDAVVTPSSPYQSSLAPSMSARLRASSDTTPDGQLELSLIHGDADRDANIIFVLWSQWIFSEYMVMGTSTGSFLAGMDLRRGRALSFPGVLLRL